MIVNKSDPTGLGLFSKTGQGFAAKSRSKAKKSASLQKNAKNQQTIDVSIQVKKSLKPFDMLESREQRKKKDRVETTPAVGQYHPKFQNKAKLTWDILKAYRNKTKRREPPPKPPKEEDSKKQKQQLVKKFQSSSIFNELLAFTGVINQN